MNLAERSIIVVPIYKYLRSKVAEVAASNYEAAQSTVALSYVSP